MSPLLLIITLITLHITYTTAILDQFQASIIHTAVALLAVSTPTPTQSSSILPTQQSPCMNNAIQQFQTAQQQCGIQFNANNAVFDAAITQQICQTNQCPPLLYSAFNSASACSNLQSLPTLNNNAISNSAQPNMFGQAAQFVQGACITAPTGKLCLPQLLNITQQITTMNIISQPLQSQIQSLCSSQCYNVLTNTYNTMSINSQFVATTQLLCASDPSTGQLCLPQLQQIGLFTGSQLSGVNSNEPLPQNTLTQANIPSMYCNGIFCIALYCI